MKGSTMNLDKKKLRAAIAEINHRRRTDFRPKWPTMKLPIDADPEMRQAYGDAWKAYYEEERRSTAQWATLLYSLQAHSRGRLHIHKLWVPICDASGCQRLEARTMEDQAKLISGVAVLFEKTPEQVAADEQRLAARLLLKSA